MKHIELFAGCGGLSLGLESAGFNLLFANELSPMAAETFAYNQLGSELANGKLENVYWLKSKFSRNNYLKRLRENLLEIENKETDFSDLDHIKNANLNRSLIIGSIRDLNSLIDDDSTGLLNSIKESIGDGNVDLISGGPPCQSFSLAGLRDHENDRNQLPWEFAKFVDKMRPKLALLENVSGILRPFKVGDKKYYAWFEVCKAFAKIGYVPLCFHVNAKYVGAAQNRPRFVMLAFREDVFYKLYSVKNDQALINKIKISESFYRIVKSGSEPDLDSIKYFDVDKDTEIFQHPIFSKLKKFEHPNLVSVKDAIHDLAYKNSERSDYVTRINKVFVNHNGKKTNRIENHEPRSNSLKVRARFRIYQLLSQMDRSVSAEFIKYMQSGGESGISENAIDQIAGKWLLNTTGDVIKSANRESIISLLNGLYTKKQTQRALIKDLPAPAALSIPDDACHYEQTEKHLRTLTVREMARIQSFPDWFSFRSKVTTGGQMRKYEVPQYTQVGNAVPPLLGLAIGEVCRDLLLLAEQSDNQQEVDESIEMNVNEPAKVALA